ncbi:MAG: NADH-quinone oxidoreductase subunit NuoH [Myxococcales bacterium]|nr:NADH-quinone oxidoreductase subunit NuoH [Myxococcales bacterium]
MRPPLRLRPLFALLTALLVALVAGCTARPGDDDLLRLIDIGPHDVEVGDTVEILGNHLDLHKDATVTFEGKLYSPGREPRDLAAGDVSATARPAPGKLTFPFTESLQAKLCGSGDAAVHTTFRGTVIVEVPSDRAGGPVVRGKVFGAVLDFRPPSLRRMTQARREKEGEAVASHLGLVLESGAVDARGVSLEGLRLREVAAGSPADKAGLAPDDVILELGGVKVSSVVDLVPGGSDELVPITVRRGAQATVRQISVAGVPRHTIPTDLVAALIALGVAAFVLLVFMAPTAGIITWFERRVSARMQSRVGPNRAGPQGFLVWVADGVKSIVKEDIIPTESDKPLFRLAPYLVFVGVSATFVVMPFGQYLIAADLDIGILFVIAVTSLVAIGLMTGGWASNNKWSLLGGIRAAAQVMSYEIPAAIAIVCVVMMTGSLRMQDIIQAQGGLGDSFLSTGGWPWYWYVFKNPVSFALFFLFFTTSLAEGNRAPFDLPEAESELVAGYSTEYSGMRYVFFFFAEWANVFVFCGIATALFLGGWQLPGVAPEAQESSLLLQLLGVGLFLVKSWALIFIVVWIRWTLPRVRIDQLMNLCWKWFVPMSFIAFTLTALWVMATQSGATRELAATSPLFPPVVQLVIGVGTFGAWLGLCALFLRRVIYNMRASKVPVHLNPFV